MLRRQATITKQKPPPLVVVGLMGCGKTTVGSRLAKALDVDFLDSDRELLTRTGRTARSFEADHGVDALHAAELGILAEVVGQRRALVFAAAASVVDTREGRALLDVGARTVWLEVDPSMLAARVAADDGSRPGELSVRSLRAQHAARAGSLEAVADLVVDGARPIGTVVGEILHWVATADLTEGAA